MLTYFLLFVLGLVFAILLLLFGRAMIFMVPILHGPVFVPSADDKLRTMLELAKVKPGQKVIDLGAGDGKIVINLAKQGIAAEGIEINPVLVKKAQLKIKQAGLEELAEVKKGNFWKLDYSDYDVIFLYGTTYIMERLEEKLMQELKPGAVVISNFFQFPNWEPESVKNEVRLYRA